MGQKAKDPERAVRQQRELLRQRNTVLKAAKYLEKAKRKGWQISLQEVMGEAAARQPWIPDGPDVPLILEAAAKVGLDVRKVDESFVFYVPGKKPYRKKGHKKGRWHA